MTIDFEKVAEAIEKSPLKIKDLMFSPELGEQIQNIAGKNNLDEETTLKLVDELGYVILNLKSRSSFVDSLIEIGIDTNIANLISKEIESKVFSELDKIKNNSDASENKEKVTKEPSDLVKNPSDNKEPQPQNSVGNSFEQIILNQARAMQPAKQADGGIMNYESRSMNRKEEKPANLPTRDSESRAIHNYVTEPDPYREPVE